MPEYAVTVSLTAADLPPSTAQGILTEFSGPQRLKRAGKVLGISILLAATLIPVPLVHLIGIPLLLSVGIYLTIRQLGAAARLSPLQLPCPKCGAPNRVGGGLGYASADRPMDRLCESCRRPLVLRIIRTSA
ncbi:MAG TPA: hypothetical protein VHW65_01190 [Gemmatimonadales bacterium]|jgi:hypothetical protein|nr:hypothetical protein [Gemmatimonadales bacterium]